MKPMEKLSTQFISYHEIILKDVDLIEDAWGLKAQFCDVIDLLRIVKAVPEREMTDRLIARIRKHH